MKKSIFTLKTILLCSLLGSSAQAQPLFSTNENLDINQIKASHMVHGDMWYDPAKSLPSLEFPKGTAKHAGYAGGLWLSAEDYDGKMHMATTLFRANGADFMPGPLDAADTIDYATSEKWARIWKINYSDIKTFLALSTKTVSTIPPSILEWPAKGNAYAKGNGGAALSISTDMAPFVDVDGDGNYNSLKGDYPKMKGEQMLWWILNDNGKAHTISKGLPLKVEVLISAYAYQRNSAADRILYYEYTIKNKSGQTYTNFRVGNWAEGDLGNPSDDFMGVDSSRRMAIMFNPYVDGFHGLNTYGVNSPISGLSIVGMPGDICGGSKVKLGSITTFEDGASGSLREPKAAKEFYYYMNSKSADGIPMGLRIGASFNLFYDIKPAYSICDTLALYAEAYRDRRFVLTTNGFDLLAVGSAQVTFAFMVTDTNALLCPSIKMNKIRELADTALKVYCNPLLPLKSPEISLSKAKLNLYPNPAQTILYISTGKNITPNESVRVIDALGKTIQLPVLKNADKFEVNINSIAAGIYSILYYDGEQTSAMSFVKN
ncbi:MAG: T9SS type A sorting domain-containing protein [Chitinophagaceae bacterium]|jgi:hypothetical protein